jgi:hypothetical protein
MIGVEKGLSAANGEKSGFVLQQILAKPKNLHARGIKKKKLKLKLKNSRKLQLQIPSSTVLSRVQPSSLPVQFQLLSSLSRA